MKLFDNDCSTHAQEDRVEVLWQSGGLSYVEAEPFCPYCK